MSNIETTLTAESPFSGNLFKQGDMRLEVVTGFSLVSLSVPVSDADELSQAVKSAYQISLPDVGKSTLSIDLNTRIMGMQSEHYWLLFDEEILPKAKTKHSPAVHYVSQKLNGQGYLSDQSDSWIMLQLSGRLSRDVLARTCPLDLHLRSFPGNTVARTTMEHLAVIIICQADNDYLLLSPRSSADTFVHLMQTSLRYVL